jgi:hypothetical protein
LQQLFAVCMVIAAAAMVYRVRFAP